MWRSIARQSHFVSATIKSHGRRAPGAAATYTTMQAGDFCILREIKSNRKYLIGPLEAGQIKDHKGGVIDHADVIGKPVRSIVRTHIDNAGFMIHKPTLEEYVMNVQRACTPVYTKDASAIVQMLDIEPGHNILEAGTGNGALTLYLARAVSLDGHVHTFDIRESHSRTAQKHVERYERGRYRDTVSFHLGDVTEMAPVIIPDFQVDGIVLDMPEPNKALEALLPVLKDDRFIVCYLPNMTQVLDLVKTIRALPVVLEACIETEWKEWEIRATQVRQTEDLAWVCRPKNYDVKGHTAFLAKLRKTGSPRRKEISSD
ncbi:S-adenosyl-L-methionine-dependent methyltransferase [Dichotomocladium elegans]|nr:S-adenosyl-L-methionine-dependent methyltransferase [Dichotomocladium elegans]